jgi:hypothetical protein
LKRIDRKSHFCPDFKGQPEPRGYAMHEAVFYDTKDEYKVRCHLCHHQCLIREGKRGICGVPWHVSAFYPAYQLLDAPPTPVAALRRAREIGLQVGLRYVYEGNVPGETGENTYCYGCGAAVIQRSGIELVRNRLQKGLCPECGKIIDGVVL